MAIEGHLENYKSWLNIASSTWLEKTRQNAKLWS